jgi:hypothetical protein
VRESGRSSDDGTVTQMRAIRLLLMLLVLLGVLRVLPAAAHESDPRIVTAVDDVVPALPPEVVVQVQAGIATQLVAANPTETVLEVVGSDGRPFLRISADGVFADVQAEEFFTTSSPTGASPGADTGGPPRWVRISSGSSWGWYDHRLHPPGLAAPSDTSAEAVLERFAVPLRYGDQEVEVRGTVRFRPLLGSFLVTADPAPQGLSVQALPGRLPGVFLSAPEGRDVLVQGRDGEPFLRITDAGVEVNTRSRTHVEDRQARGQQVAPPAPTPEFELVAPGSRSYTWLDARLRYPQDLPPADVLRADGPSVVQEWRVPASVDGAPAALTGDVTWVPEADAAQRVSGAAAGAEEAGTPLLPYALGAGALLALAAAVLAVRRRGAQRQA